MFIQDKTKTPPKTKNKNIIQNPENIKNINKKQRKTLKAIRKTMQKYKNDANKHESKTMKRGLFSVFPLIFRRFCTFFFLFGPRLGHADAPSPRPSSHGGARSSSSKRRLRRAGGSQLPLFHIIHMIMPVYMHTIMRMHIHIMHV